jgi:hypothetical protein
MFLLGQHDDRALLEDVFLEDVPRLAAVLADATTDASLRLHDGDTNATHSVQLDFGEHLQQHDFVQVRFYSALGDLAPADNLATLEADIFAVPDRKLAKARDRRNARREATRPQAVD